ncbi:hypothetical protein [Siminovitchia sp. 179-K 8D1 HS]|uniref:hypothetical protein n=1 Tax=Siminovitchia sp. 179-K 8D1 HS TaxID=3142385 RepID=UPI00399F79C6
MFKFFSFINKQQEKEDKINSLILAKLDRMIELLEQQQLQKQPQEQPQQPKEESGGKTIHFDHVQIDHLENIIFRLDNIEIDELSGKLLIGTNISGSEEFAASLGQKMDKKTSSQKRRQGIRRKCRR